jgi:transcriptional regulator with XRE-family HTH domain
MTAQRCTARAAVSGHATPRPPSDWGAKILTNGSLDRFYLETSFSKGHLSQILRGQRSPSLATLVKLARALDAEVADFFAKPGDRGAE